MKPVTLRRWELAVAFVAITVAFVVQGVLLKREIELNGTARQALCAQRDDLDDRIARSERLLTRNQGRLIFGIPRSVILASVNRDHITRRNLEILDCAGDS